MSKLSFRARALDASKPMPIYLAEELPDLPDYSAINRAVPQMPSGMEKEEECEHHLQRAICTGLIIPTPEVCDVQDLEFYERCYPPDYKMPKQHIHMQPLWQEQEAPEYDIDSEDELWLKQQRHPELTELMFEQMMDKLEKSSGQTVVTLNEAKLLLERNDDLVIAVYDYWLNKRLKTQHPLILSVKTESRPGQSSNNPYLAFRRRTEKMQTRKNRKNDESSYEKMLKLRRDLARALSLLELVARRERHKRELLRLTADIAERRYRAGDFVEPAPRPQYAAVSLATPTFRRDAYSVQHYPPRAPPTPVDQPRQREKRPYKRRKHRHRPGSALALREPAYNSSSEEEARAATPPDDGPFAFRRKPGCYYEMPTATLCGDPVDPEAKDGLFEHEIDPRHRFTLASLSSPYPRCVGFARLRRARGGRLALDRVATPLDSLWRALPPPRRRPSDEIELETKVHRTPKELTRDYHTSGKYPWRHAFRKHLAANPELWVKPDPADVKPDVKVKPDLDVKLDEDSVKSDISVRTIDSAVIDNLHRVIRKRAWSGCSSDDSDGSLHPVEREFEQFIDEVNKKWLHFRPKTPPPSPLCVEQPAEDQFPIGQDTPISVELRAEGLDAFTTSDFTLGSLYDLPDDSLDLSDDIIHEDLTLTEAQVENILAETDLKSLAEDRKEVTEDLLDKLVEEVDPFLSRQRRREPARGSSRVRVSAAREPIYVDDARAQVLPAEPAAAPAPPRAPPAPAPPDEPQIKVEKKKKEDTIEEVQIAGGVQLKTVQSVHSPLKKHIITAGAPRRPDAPQLVTVAVSEALKVRLQNHLLASSAAAPVVGLVHNGPFAASQPEARGAGAGAGGARLVQLAPAPHKPPLLLGAPAGKLKVLHAHPLTTAQRAQLLHSHAAAGVAQLPAVVSLAALDAKAGGAALLKAPGSVAQLFEIKAAPLGKGPHVVNVVRAPAPRARAEPAPAPRRALLQALEPHAKVAGAGAGAGAGAAGAGPRAPRVSLALDGRQLVRAAGVRAAAPQLLRHQIQLKQRRPAAPTISIPAPAKTAAIPPAVVANLLQKNVSFPAPRLALPPAAFGAAQLRARHARLAPHAPRSPDMAESAPAAAASADEDGSVRRRAADTLPMQVT